MSYFRKQLLFFFLGVALAAVFVPISHFFLPKFLPSDKRLESKVEASGDRSPYRSRPSLSRNIAKSKNHVNQNGGDLSQTRAQQIISNLKSAIAKGDYWSLSSLRPSSLQSLGIPADILDPKLKAMMLKKLLSLMEFDDWNYWREKLHGGTNHYTKAMEFVRDVRTINPEFGRYLETSSLLLSDLYLTTSQGRVFHIEESLYAFIMDAQRLFQSRTPQAISPRVYLDSTASDDQTLQLVLEKTRTILILDYIKLHPRRLESHFLLLSTIPHQYVNSQVINVYRELLQIVSHDVSSRFREELRQSFLRTEGVQDLLAISPGLSQAIETLLRQCFQDRLESENLDSARQVLLQLHAQFPDTKGLTELSLALEQAKSAQAQDMTIADPLIAQNSLFTDTEEVSAENSYSLTRKIEIVGYIIVLFGIFFLIFKKSKMSVRWLGAIFTRSSSATKDLDSELDRSIKEGKTVPLSSLSLNPRRIQDGPRFPAAAKSVNSR